MTIHLRGTPLDKATVSVLEEGTFSAPNARQFVARQRFAGQKDHSMRLIRNSPDEILEMKLSIFK